MINYVVVDLIRTTQQRLDAAAPSSIDDIRRRAKPLAGMSDTVRTEHLELKKFLNEHVYRHYKVLRMTTKSRRIITDLFNVFMNDVNLMPTEHRDAAHRAKKSHGDAGRARTVADYIAGMTDRYAILEHGRVFEAGERV
jgi:dGTPase